MGQSGQFYRNDWHRRPAAMWMPTVLEFCLQEQCALDTAGRLKLSATAWRDFQRHTDGEVVLYCLPEGAIGIFPPDLWAQIHQPVTTAGVSPADSLVLRRQMRRFGALAQSAVISNQGRVTLPPLFRDYAGLVAGQDVHVSGCELGVEVWQPARWAAELEQVQKHFHEKGAQQMHADLIRSTP